MRAISTVAIVLCIALAPNMSVAKGGKAGGSRPSYAGSKHSSSHDGHYQGGQGRSHKGGDYRNSRTGNQYGKHKP